MDRTIWDSILFVMLKSCRIWGSAGATIDDAKGERNVNAAVKPVAAHFWLEGQFLGFRGSLGPLNLT